MKTSARRPAVVPGVSPIHGRGVFAGMPLPGRRKIGEVTGRLVRLPDARRRVERRAVIQLVELDDRTALDCSRGNAFGRMNHSCAPNCFLRVFNRRVEVYALRPIREGEELTVDYGATPHLNGMHCRCGSPRCRGVL
jgi:uncharacterized protein